MSAASTPDRIFISYRRDDARGASGRLYDWLRIGFGSDRVFRDVASIGVGKWRDSIEAALAQSAVCVAVVGPRWANADNLPRLHDENDMVRHELLAALGRADITVVPTLVEGAEVPKGALLPEALRPLFNVWNARPVTEAGWEDDTRRLIAEIAKATRLPVGTDLDSLLRDAGAAQQRLAELESTRHLQADQLEAMRRTVGELTAKLADASASERQGLGAAFAALARGDSRGAEDAFEREFEAQDRAQAEARCTMAVAARNVANLALTRDVAKAVTFYRKAVAADPVHADTARLLGMALITLGDLKGARAALTDAIRLAHDQGESWCEMTAESGLGDVLRRSGELPAAQQAFQRALGLALQRLAAEPDKPARQRDLMLVHNRLGATCVASGDAAQALAEFRLGLATAVTLAAGTPANALWQRDLAECHSNIGDALVAQGEPAQALAAFRQSLAIREALALREPGNLQLQRTISVSHNRIGSVLLGQGDKGEAMLAYRAGRVIAEALATSDPANALWQGDLAASHERVANVLFAQGQMREALAAYQAAAAIREAQAARDPANAQWQRNLATSHANLGGALAQLGEAAPALAAHRQSLALREAGAARDPHNTEWQTDVASSCAKLGALVQGQSVDERRALLERGRGILLALKAAGRLLPNQDRIAAFDKQLAGLGKAGP